MAQHRIKNTLNIKNAPIPLFSKTSSVRVLAFEYSPIPIPSTYTITHKVTSIFFIIFHRYCLLFEQHSSVCFSCTWVTVTSFTAVRTQI